MTCPRYPQHSDSGQGTVEFGPFQNCGGAVTGYAVNSNIVGQYHEHYHNSSRTASADEKAKQEALMWLSPLDYSAKQRDFHEKAAPNTGQWLLDSEEFVSWRSQEIRKLWCIGMPGTGKTILASIIVNHLKEPIFKPGRNDPAVIYLYLTYKEQPSLEHLLGSVIKQLVEERELPSSIKKLWDSQRFKTTEHRNHPSLRDLDEILTELTKDRQVYIIVDALDECTPKLRKMLIASLRKIREDINLLVTSRLLEGLETMVVGFKRLEVVAQKEDIHKYIDNVITKAHRLQDMFTREKDLGKEIRYKVTAKCSRMFLLAQLHMDAITAQITPYNARKTLEELPTSLEDTYKSTMSRIRTQDEQTRKYAIRILSWIVYAFRPLSLKEILHALAVEKGDCYFHQDKMLFAKYIEAFCCGLVAIDKETATVRLVHYTAQNYFDRHKDEEFPGFHREITFICATYLCMTPLEQPDSPGGIVNKMSPAEDVYEHPKDFDQESQDMWHARERHKNMKGVPKYRNRGSQHQQLQGSNRPERLSFRMKLQYYPFVIYAGQYLGQHFQQIPGGSSDNEIISVIRPLLEKAPKRNFYQRLLDKLGTYFVHTYLDGGYSRYPGRILESSDSEDGFFEEPLSLKSSDDHQNPSDITDSELCLDSEKNSMGLRLEQEATVQTLPGFEGKQVEEARSERSDAFDEQKIILSVNEIEQSHGSRLSVSPSGDGGTSHGDLLLSETSALHLAVFLGCSCLVLGFIEDGMHVDATDDYGQSALIIAVKRSYADIITILLQHGATVDLTTDKGHSLLLYSAQQDSLATVGEIISRACAERIEPVDKPEPNDQRLVFMSQWMELVLCIATAIWSHFLTVIRNRDRKSLRAATEEAPGQIKRQRSVLGQLQPEEMRHYTELLSAAYSGNTATILKLIDSLNATIRAERNHSSDILHSTQARFVKTACFLAIEGGHLETVSQLLDCKIDPNTRDYQDRTLLHRAVSRNHYKIAELLLKRGASPLLRDGKGMTAWTANASHEKAEVLALLKRYGAKPDAKDDEGVNPIYHAAARGDVQRLEFLLNQGVDPSTTTIYGWAPLHWAAHNGHLECVHLLIRWKANLSPVSDQAVTPLDQARINNKDVIADMLEEAGAKSAVEVYAERGSDEASQSYYPKNFPIPVMRARLRIKATKS